MFERIEEVMVSLKDTFTVNLACAGGRPCVVFVCFVVLLVFVIFFTTDQRAGPSCLSKMGRWHKLFPLLWKKYVGPVGANCPTSSASSPDEKILYGYVDEDPTI